jgi:hypothetical protein
MDAFFRLANADLQTWLAKKMPALGKGWWRRRVVKRLNANQQCIVAKKGLCTLHELDFAALIRTFEQNWQALNLPDDKLHLATELQAARNKWAHAARDLPADERYRDADTLGRFLGVIDALQETRRAVDSVKKAALAEMARREGWKPTSVSDESAVAPPIARLPSGENAAREKSAQALSAKHGWRLVKRNRAVYEDSAKKAGAVIRTSKPYDLNCDYWYTIDQQDKKRLADYGKGFLVLSFKDRDYCYAVPWKVIKEEWGDPRAKDGRWHIFVFFDAQGNAEISLSERSNRACVNAYKLRFLL